MATYLVELDVVGIKNRVFIEVPGDDEDEACDIALFAIASVKMNDCSVESVVEIK